MNRKILICFYGERDGGYRVRIVGKFIINKVRC